MCQSTQKTHSTPDLALLPHDAISGWHWKLHIIGQVFLALAFGSVRYATFIDLEKAFDIVDYTRLRSLLVRRGYPGRILGLIESLTFRGLRSRVLVNGQSSD